MHRLPKILCLFALAACAPLLHAQSQPIYRCLGVNGEPVFSGQPCGTPAPATSNGTAAPDSPGFGLTCVASPQALRRSIAEAFTRHDVNRLAGLLLWRSMDQASARSALRGLTEWLKQPLAGIAIAYAAGPPPGDGDVSATASGNPASASSAAQTPTGFEISTGGGGTRDFGIVESGGCWWLTF